MHIDFRASGNWQRINDSVSERLAGHAVDFGAEARIYQGIRHALVEAVIGVSQLYPLKKKVFYFNKMNPYFEMAILPLAKLGYKLMPLELSVLDAPDEWVSTLGREDLLLLYSVDDPLLGRTYNCEKLESLLADKNLVQIRVSHARHFISGLSSELPRYRVNLYSLAAPTLALACLGDRTRFGVQTAPQLFYDDVTDEMLNEVVHPAPLSEESVSAWQNDLALAVHASVLWPDRGDRINDRALIYWSDIDGYALIDRLASRLNFSLRSPGFENRIETTSLSRWGGVKTMDFYREWGIDPNILRGLIMVSSSFRTAGGFTEALSQARNDVLKDQYGSAD